VFKCEYARKTKIIKLHQVLKQIKNKQAAGCTLAAVQKMLSRGLRRACKVLRQQVSLIGMQASAHSCIILQTKAKATTCMFTKLFTINL
jgi:hypothetical protein